MKQLLSVDLRRLSSLQRGVVINMRLSNPELPGDLLRKRFLVHFPSENLFGERIRQLTTLCQEIRDYIVQFGVNLAAFWRTKLCVLLQMNCMWNMKKERLQKSLQLTSNVERCINPNSLLLSVPNLEGPVCNW